MCEAKQRCISACWLLSILLDAIPSRAVVKFEIWEEPRYCVVPSPQRLWIAWITVCSAAWLFEAGPDLRIFHAWNSQQNPWLLLIRISAIQYAVMWVQNSIPRKPRKQHPPWKNSTRQPWKEPSTRLVCAKYQKVVKCYEHNKQKLCTTFMLWQTRDFTNLSWTWGFTVLDGALCCPCLTAVAPSLGASCGKVALRSKMVKSSNCKGVEGPQKILKHPKTWVNKTSTSIQGLKGLAVCPPNFPTSSTWSASWASQLCQAKPESLGIWYTIY